MKALVDNQQPQALSDYLRNRGVESLHVKDLNLQSASDAEIWQFAAARDYVVISKDSDFAALSTIANPPGRFIWVRIGNCRKQALIDTFERLWSEIEARIKVGEKTVELIWRSAVSGSAALPSPSGWTRPTPAAPSAEPPPGLARPFPQRLPGAPRGSWRRRGRAGTLACSR